MPLPPPTTQPSETAAPPRHGDLLATILAVAAVYVYFLIFAEFALIENLRDVVGENGLQPLMAALGLAGIGGSLAAAKWFDPGRGSRQLVAGFTGCGGAAGLSLLAGHPAVAFAAGATVGGCLAWTTVTLALCLNATVPARRLGLCCGFGTGLAYFFCNQPLVFSASPHAQTWLAVGAALGGIVLSFRLRSAPAQKSDAPEYRPLLVAVWVLLFFALVWIDSAAFFIIQHSEELKGGTWQGTAVLQGNALVHLVAAIVTGWLLDRQQQPLTVGTALVLLLGACVVLAHHASFPAARILYTAGVSIYSTALVFYPARGGRPWLAGLLYAASGWFGSAMGIGMAQSLKTVPLTFVVVAAVVAVTAFAVRAIIVRRTSATRAVLLLLAGFAVSQPREVRAEDPAVTLGREVYLGEGCIHCHSQYVRPGTMDVQRWGPTTPLEESLKQKPPLYGNRRQGPDLAQVGSRRTPEWNRLHLIAPRSLRPGSRMPSYAHLFKDNDPRGDALVAYLASLGSENVTARLETAQAWTPAKTSVLLSAEKQRALFAELCTSCHGPDGQGNGPLAAKLSLRPPDFTRDPWRHATENDPELELKLARLVKFGQPGTAMAGHEYLRDNEIVSLARFVIALHSARSTPGK